MGSLSDYSPEDIENVLRHRLEDPNTSEAEKAKIRDRLGDGGRSKETTQESRKKLEDEGFSVKNLFSTGKLEKTMRRGNISARFSTVPAKTTFEIDSDTDQITLSNSTNISRKSFRYMAASVVSFAMGDDSTRLPDTWSEKEKVLMELPLTVINALISLYNDFERSVAELLSKLDPKA